MIVYERPDNDYERLEDLYNLLDQTSHGAAPDREDIDKALVFIRKLQKKEEGGELIS